MPKFIEKVHIMPNEIYSICFMCTVRCPIRVMVENDDVIWIQGNPHVPGIEGALCAKGSAGLALLHDTERPQYPMIRTGPRGAGQWRRASWEEALDYVADRLQEIIREHGPAKPGLRGAHQPQYPYQQDLHEGPGLPQPLHP